MFCTECGKSIAKSSKFCPHCGTSTTGKETSDNAVETKKVNHSSNSNNNSNNRVFKILSYVGILWIVGLLSNSKEDKSVRFHIGQGIILSICLAVIGIVINIFSSIFVYRLFASEISYWGIGTGVYEASGFGLFILGVLYLAYFVFFIYMLVMGANNVNRNEDKPLPLIGKFAFFK